MDDWKLFSDARFTLQFKFPNVAEDGEGINWVETQQEGIHRVHLLSPKSREVYFEISKYDSLTAEIEYQRHKEYLQKQFHPLAITELKETICASLPAYEYTFEWDQGIRTVILVERAEATYRLLYNPLFPVNLQILSTFEWLHIT